MASPVLSVRIPGTPRGQGSMTLWKADDGTDRAKYAAPVVAHRNLMIGMLREEWSGREPLGGAVAVRVRAEFARPKSHFGTGRNAGSLKEWAPRWVVTPTDSCKIARLVDDALEISGVIGNDSQVSVIRVEKRYSDSPSASGYTRVEVFVL